MKPRLHFPGLPLVLAIAAIALFPVVSLRAQTGAPEQAAAAALELYNRGQTNDAIAAYEKILKDYPTSLIVADAQFRLGYLYFQQGSLERSAEMLAKVMGPPAPAEIQEMAAGLLPQVTSARASKASDPKKTELFKEAIKQFDSYIAKYPNRPEVESAVYGKALAQYQTKSLEDAVAGLRLNLARFPKSESIQESEYLLGLSLAAQGKDQEAEKWLSGIVGRHTDLSLANEAQFQLGELLFNRALSAEPNAKSALFEKAVSVYAAVRRRDEVVKAQQDRLAGLVQRIREAGIRRDVAAVKATQQLQKSETAKLAALKAKPETYHGAQLKAAICYFQTQKYAQALEILQRVQAVAEDDAQKKQIQYYIALCQISLEQADKALAAYAEFQSKYRGDSIAENLPVALGSMFLNLANKGQGSADNLEQAKKYFAEAQTIYPQGKFTSQAILLQAGALLQQKRLGDAEQGYRKFLATNPKRELAAQAELGLAGIAKDTGRLDQSLAAYKAVREKYTGLPEAEQAAFWVGQLTLLKGDPKAALSELGAFLEKYPGSVLRPSAQFALAQAQQAQGAKAQAQALFQEILDKSPKSDAAPYACFQLAAIYASEQKGEEMVALMRKFIADYPESDKIFYAFDTIGQSQIAANKPLEAIATYSEMADKYPKNEQAPEALLKVATLWTRYAQSQGIYTALTETQRSEWNKAIQSSLQTGSKLLESYPESKTVALALQSMLDDQKLLLAARIKTAPEVESYFQELAAKFESKPALKSKVLFKLAAYLYEKDKASALQQMTAAYNPQLLYAPADLDLYGGALLESDKLPEARQVFEKLATDYPIPSGLTPDKAPPQIQEAQAISLYGLGKVLQKQQQVADSAAKFDQLKRLYPWSPKILDANFGIAQSLARQKKWDDAAALLVQIIRAQTATAELRANAMVLGGDIQKEKGNLEAAIDYYIKIATFYEGVPTAAAEGLCKGAELLELQAASLSESSKPSKSAQIAKAIKAYKELTEKYPNSPFVEKAKGRLQQLASAK